LARTTIVSLLYLKVRNIIGGDIPIDVPQPKYWWGCVPGIPGGVDASGWTTFIYPVLRSGTAAEGNWRCRRRLLLSRPPTRLQSSLTTY